MARLHERGIAGIARNCDSTDLRPMGGHLSRLRLVRVHGTPTLNTPYWTEDRSEKDSLHLHRERGAPERRRPARRVRGPRAASRKMSSKRTSRPDATPSARVVGREWQKAPSDCARCLLHRSKRRLPMATYATHGPSAQGRCWRVGSHRTRPTFIRTPLLSRSSTPRNTAPAHNRTCSSTSGRRSSSLRESSQPPSRVRTCHPSNLQQWERMRQLRGTARAEPAQALRSW